MTQQTTKSYNTFSDNFIDDIYLYNIYSNYLRTLPQYINTNIFKDSIKEIIEEIQDFQDIDIIEDSNYYEENNNNGNEYNYNYDSDTDSEYTTETSDSDNDEDGWIST